MKNKDVENASLNSQIFKLNEVVTEGSENNTLLLKKLSEVEEDLSNITPTWSAIEIDMDLMDCSHESEQVGYCESLVLLDFIRIYICFQANFDYSDVRTSLRT